ncbi:MAG: hypothetical protein K2F78_04325, partial [Muribaculaceae bacterium]|nr:hypothetical protein [Muribaculaceae bacterium]
ALKYDMASKNSIDMLQGGLARPMQCVFGLTCSKDKYFFLTKCKFGKKNFLRGTKRIRRPHTQ